MIATCWGLCRGRMHVRVEDWLRKIWLAAVLNENEVLGSPSPDSEESRAASGRIIRLIPGVNYRVNARRCS